VIEGSGFDAASIVHVAQYEPRGGWRYISSLQPVRAEARKLDVPHCRFEHCLPEASASKGTMPLR